MKALRQRRKESRYTLAQVATALGFSRPSTISAYESGNRKPNIDILQKLAKLYGCTVDELLDKDEETASTK